MPLGYDPVSQAHGGETQDIQGKILSLLQSYLDRVIALLGVAATAGNATAANQVLEIAELTDINSNTTGIATEFTLQSINAYLDNFDRDGGSNTAETLRVALSNESQSLINSIDGLVFSLNDYAAAAAPLIVNIDALIQTLQTLLVNFDRDGGAATPETLRVVLDDNTIAILTGIKDFVEILNLLDKNTGVVTNNTLRVVIEDITRSHIAATQVNTLQMAGDISTISGQLTTIENILANIDSVTILNNGLLGSLSTIESTLTLMYADIDDMTINTQKANWDKIQGNSIVYTWTVVNTNPVVTIIDYKTGGITIFTQTLTYDVNDNVTSITTT